MTKEAETVACSECFRDQGLRLDAERIGTEVSDACPNCGSVIGKKLSLDRLAALSYRFFVWGSLLRRDYGAAPLIQFNKHQKTSVLLPAWLQSDAQLIERTLGVGFFHYGPRLWMIGEVEPLKALQDEATCGLTVKRILAEYPGHLLRPGDSFYRIRKAPQTPEQEREYDSPPQGAAGSGRLDSSALLSHEEATEFESLDMAVHMLFLAGAHSYPVTRRIVGAVREAGFDGIVYPSYFSLLRLGIMPFETAYGLSRRRFPSVQQYEQEKSIPNIAIFGRPIEEKKLEIQCINRLILNRVEYGVHFGPVGFS